MTQETMKTVGYLKELNSLTFIRQLATRLPSFYCNRWRESARKIEDQKKDYTFDDLVEFVQGPHGEGMQRKAAMQNMQQRCKPHATVLHDESSNASVEKSGEPPTQERGESAISNCIKAKQPSRRNAATYSLIVPVWLKHQDNPQRKIEVYAILDDQSDVCFITDRVRKDLGLKGKEVQLELSTMCSVEIIDTLRIDGMEVMRNDEKVEISLPKTYSREVIPAKREQIPTPEVALRWKHLQRIADKIQPYREDLPIGILIGNSCVRAIKPRDVIPGKSNDPYAIRTTLGWGIIGPASPEGTHEGKVLESAACHRITSTEITSKTAPANKLVHVKQHKKVMKPEAIRTLLEQDFKDGQINTKPLSQEDLRFLRTMKEGIHLTEDQHYEMPLPLREGNIDLPFNRKQVENRLQQLRKRLERDSKYKEDYTKFMEDMITNGYAEKAPQTTTAKWYIPHHGVYNPRKPGKIRVVFDCSAEFNGHSLNSHLMQGPDLTNSLIGVLCRFRQERTAIACDIEGMFHQVRVNSEHRDFLRFLWWEKGDTSQEPQEFRMRVHLFGATSSPGCANLALKTTADDNEAELGQEPSNFLRKNFYVDDGLKSVNSEDHAIKLIETTKQLCKRGGFRLHKFTSNSKTVIETIAEEDRAKGIKNIDLDKQPLPLERVLGVEWCTESDNLKFRITLKDKPLTRRGVLATISSIYDPLGLAAPFLLKGKRILQRLCKENVEWDDPIPQDLRAQWEKWRGELHLLEELSVPRCFLTADFGELKNVELHHFSDASNEGYGQCSYLRLVDEHDKINCSLVMGKARVAPLKPFTIPRLELTAALVSVKTSELLAQELEYPSPEETFWTDSMVVKAYIQNDARRFHTIVANRVQQIRNSTDPNQWNLQELAQEHATLEPDDKEVKRVYTLTTATTPTQKWPTLAERISIFSDWFQAVRAIANCLRYLAILRDNVKLKKSTESSDQNPLNANKPMTTEELKNAEVKIIKEAQKVAFTEDVRTLSFNKETTKSSQLRRLDPFLDHDGVLRVGGRLKHSPMPEEIKHPAILPRKGQVTEMLLRHLHNKSDHQGRGVTVNEVRSSGFWIIGCTSAVSELLIKCTIC
ncbi:uncharacterized protein LOC110246561 [Exaiptasia diaphana]|uniref:Peptidase aspartic putative domain-containing protein n=1 Tax=Exaiptasia diaphana TaxID=2652724 RepID=A0A913YNT3_EXADI|nr:uncharacterized protein LOC110246561 [Exaiptasia diaphana]